MEGGLAGMSCDQTIVLCSLNAEYNYQVDGQETEFLQALDDLNLDDANAGMGETTQTDPFPNNLPWRSGRIIRPTWKVIESRPEPPTVHVETPPVLNRRVSLLVRETFHGT